MNYELGIMEFIICAFLARHIKKIYMVNKHQTLKFILVQK